MRESVAVKVTTVLLMTDVVVIITYINAIVLVFYCQVVLRQGYGR